MTKHQPGMESLVSDSHTAGQQLAQGSSPHHPALRKPRGTTHRNTPTPLGNLQTPEPSEPPGGCGWAGAGWPKRTVVGWGHRWDTWDRRPPQPRGHRHTGAANHQHKSYWALDSNKLFLKFYVTYDTIRTFDTNWLSHGAKEWPLVSSGVTMALLFS